MMHRYGGFQNFKTFKDKLYSKTISNGLTICDIGLVIKDQIIKKKAFKDKKSVFCVLHIIVIHLACNDLSWMILEIIFFFDYCPQLHFFTINRKNM